MSVKEIMECLICDKMIYSNQERTTTPTIHGLLPVHWSCWERIMDESESSEEIMAKYGVDV